MKAILMRGYGGPEVLEYGDAPDPVAAPGEIVVDVHAASLNPADWKVREGAAQGRRNAAFPAHPGAGFFGRRPRKRRRPWRSPYTATAPTVADFRPGDPVFAINEQGCEGAYAEAVAIPAALAARKPDFLSHAEAAALAITGLTSLRALEDEAKLKAGETILISTRVRVTGGVPGEASPWEITTIRGSDGERFELIFPTSAAECNRHGRRGLHDGERGQLTNT